MHLVSHEAASTKAMRRLGTPYFQVKEVSPFFFIDLFYTKCLKHKQSNTTKEKKKVIERIYTAGGEDTE
jgi:hypothetical protein